MFSWFDTDGRPVDERESILAIWKAVNLRIGSELNLEKKMLSLS